MNDNRKISLKVLGSGTSTGVPLVGCSCPVCTSADPRDRRDRCGFYVSLDGFGIQIDVSPDFRNQALRHSLPRVDAVIVTHAHADHCLGLDDIRRYNTIQNCEIPLWAREGTLNSLKRIFGYVFECPPSQVGMYRPRLAANALPVFPEAAQIGPFLVRALPVPHGPVESVAVELAADSRRIVLCSDCSAFTPELQALAREADIFVLDGLRDRPHAAHLTVDDARAALAKSNCRIGRFVHIGHDISHAELLGRCADTPRIKPTFDGEELEI